MARSDKKDSLDVSCSRGPSRPWPHRDSSGNRRDWSRDGSGILESSRCCPCCGGPILEVVMADETSRWRCHRTLEYVELSTQVVL